MPSTMMIWMGLKSNTWDLFRSGGDAGGVPVRARRRNRARLYALTMKPPATARTWLMLRAGSNATGAGFTPRI